MTGRVVIVTGASSGIGYQVAQELCGGGNDVILACRSEEKATAAISRIKLVHPSAMATYMHLDLSSLESVREFVRQFLATGKGLNLLINNAAVRLYGRDRQIQYSAENLELTMATNYVGHFLLTNLLLEVLKVTSTSQNGARVINVTSSAHDLKSYGILSGIHPLNVDNMLLLKDRTYSGLQAYKNSKLAQIMFTYQMSKRLDGSGVTINAITPAGVVPGTELLRHASLGQRFYQRSILDGVLRFAKFTQNVHQAAFSICLVGIDDAFKDVTGKYLVGASISTSSEESLNEEMQEKLWDLTARYSHLEGYEPLDAPAPPATEAASAHDGSTLKKMKNKSTPESDKKPRRLFSFGRARKEEKEEPTADLGEKETNGRKSAVENGEKHNVTKNADAVIEAEIQEIQDGIKSIDLSTDVEERLGKGEGEEKAQQDEKEVEKIEEKVNNGVPQGHELGAEDKKHESHLMNTEDEKKPLDSKIEEIVLEQHHGKSVDVDNKVDNAGGNGEISAAHEAVKAAE